MTLVLARPSTGYHKQIKDPMHRPASNGAKNQNAIKSNIVEYHDQVKIMVALPGFKKEEVKINLENGKLVVEGKVVRGSIQEKESKYNLREFAVNDFKKTFQLYDDFNVAMINAKYADGILTIVLPKNEKLKKEILVS